MTNKEYSRASPELGLPNVCEGITLWYQEEVDMLVKSMADAMDKTIIDLILKGKIKWQT
jgi:hypothetical protein